MGTTKALGAELEGVLDAGNQSLLQELFGTREFDRFTQEIDREYGERLEFTKPSSEVLRRMNEVLRRELLKASNLSILCRSDTSRSLTKLYIEIVALYRY